jgi:hypothetical protein
MGRRLFVWREAMTESSDDETTALMRQALTDDSPMAEQIRWHIAGYLTAHFRADPDAKKQHRQMCETLLAQYRCPSCGS